MRPVLWREKKKTWLQLHNDEFMQRELRKNVITRGMCCINLLLNCSAVPQKIYEGRSLWSGLPLRFPSWRCWILSTSPRTSLLSTPRTNGKKDGKHFFFSGVNFDYLDDASHQFCMEMMEKGPKERDGGWKIAPVRWLVFSAFESISLSRDSSAMFCILVLNLFFALLLFLSSVERNQFG